MDVSQCGMIRTGQYVSHLQHVHTLSVVYIMCACSPGDMYNIQFTYIAGPSLLATGEAATYAARMPPFTVFPVVTFVNQFALTTKAIKYDFHSKN